MLQLSGCDFLCALETEASLDHTSGVDANCIIGITFCASARGGDVTNRLGKRVLKDVTGLALVLTLGALPIAAQSNPDATVSRNSADADGRITALNQSLEQTRVELAETRAELKELRSMLEQLTKQKVAADVANQDASTETPHTASSLLTSPGRTEAPVDQPSAKITADDWQVLNAKVEEHTQDKVESGSKYRVKLWGLALFNAFSVSGQVDNVDVPAMAFSRSAGDSSGSLGASLRQSTFGITGTGPDLLGARTSADLQLDFFGGLPSGYSSSSSGLVRLRLSRIRLDWDHTSLIAGLDTPFFSPNLPTSYMSLAVPAFASSGDLRTWAPTTRIEQRFDTSFTRLKVEAGFEDPSGYATSDLPIRQPTPGESSRQPVYAVRFSANGHSGDRPASVGVSGLYLPQHFGEGLNAAGWGSILDWRFPLIPHTELSGEVFAGKGMDSLGGLPVPFVQPQNYNPYSQYALAQIPAVGGWTQLKYSVNSRNEFNVAVGTGARNSSQLGQLALVDPTLATLSPRNEMIFANYIIHPRSNLLFSAEYRRLRTYPLFGAPAVAGQIGLAAGFLF
jgi:hypothetical protein